MGKPIIEINNLSKCYRLGQFGFSSFREEAEKWMRRARGLEVAEENARDFWALRDVSFTVQPGEVVGIIGRNGAGKSTLLKILSRITEPTNGEVVLRGRVASLLEVGTGFHPELSGRENVFLNGTILGMRKAEIARKFDEIVDFAEVEKFIDTPVKRYSSGMYVKLAFAVAAHLEPEILIVDEVLAVGDSRFQQRCTEKMRQMATQQGMTLLFVSHNMSIIRSLCNRGVLLSQGQNVFDGSGRDAVKTYLSDTSSLPSSLADRKNRAGTGRVRVLDILICGGDGVARPRFAAGETLKIEVKTSGWIRDITCFINLVDDMGSPVAHFNSALFPSKNLASSTNSIVCSVPELHLNDGRYILNVCLRCGDEFLDDLDNAAEFEVELGPLSSLGINRASRIGRAYLPHNWTLPC
jgi:lipopolysaccharide transport system ATP-binding protein